MQRFHVLAAVVVTLAAFLANTSAAYENQLDLHLRSHEPPYDLPVVKKYVREKKIPILPIIVEEEETFTVPVGYEIAYVKAVDQKQNGHGAKVVVIAGGLGESFVTLKFESQRGHSIDYLVEIYADRIRPGQPNNRNYPQ